MINIRLMIYKLFLLALLICNSVEAKDVGKIHKDYSINKQNADSLYNNEKYESAAKTYSYIIENQGIAPELYYNLGNCYYRLDSMAFAILNYERALKLDPSDSDTRYNLSLARSKIIDRSTEISDFFILAWWYTIVNKFSLFFWKCLGFVFFIIALICIFIYYINIIKKIYIVKYLIISSFFLFFLCNLAAWHQYKLSIDIQAAIVTSDKVAIKSSPSISSSDLFILHSGSRLKILDNSIKEWSEVRYEEGKEGWINNKDISII